MKRQPSLFKFEPTAALRNSGFTPEEERDLIIASMSGPFPREHTVERTGTYYRFDGPEAVKRTLKALKFSNKIDREQLAA